MTVEKRIDKLEGTNRQYRVLLALIAVAAVVWVCVTAIRSGTVPDLVQARRFEVVDILGRVQVELNSALGIGTVSVFGEFGKIKGTVLITHGGVIVLGDDDNTLVQIGADKDNDGLIKTFSSSGTEMVTIWITEEGGMMKVSNKDAEPAAGLLVDEYGDGVVAVYDRDGRSNSLRVPTR